MSVLTFHFVVSFIWRGIVLFFGFMVTLGRSGLTWNSVGMVDGHYNPNLVSFKRKEAALEPPPPLFQKLHGLELTANHVLCLLVSWTKKDKEEQ